MTAAKPDCTGQVFGYLTVVGRVTCDSNPRRHLWRLRCVCGKIIDRARGQFDAPRYKNPSCGCQKFNVVRSHPLQKPDCTGQRFGHLTVLGKGETSKRGGKTTRLWDLLCDCGNTISRVRADFDKKRGQISCGCARKQGWVDNKRRPRDISGQRFGHLVVIELTGTHNRQRQPTWRCLCDCGRYVNLACKQLTNSNYSPTCGSVNPDCPYYRLWFPPTPNPYPCEAGVILSKYISLSQKLSYKYANHAIEDEIVDRLIRSCWILVCRKRAGEVFSPEKERLYILKCLSFAGIAVYRRRAIEKGGGIYYDSDNSKYVIGTEMTNSTSKNYPVIETLGTMPMPKSKKFSFKRR